MNRLSDYAVLQEQRRLADSNRCRRSERRLHVNDPHRGFVYFAEASRARLKIGWTANPEDRFGRLERAIGEDVLIWACTPGTRADERRFHQQWSHEHIEWFRATAELLAFAESLP
jgi:hypothetical protein